MPENSLARSDDFSSLSFIKGLLLGQLSIVILIGAFIKFFIFGDPSSADVKAPTRGTSRKSHTISPKDSQVSVHASSAVPRTVSLNKKRSTVLRNPPSLTINTILSKAYYNVDSHQPESLDWFNVLIAQTIAQFRLDAQHNDAILTSLTSVLNGESRPDYVGEIKVTELSLGEEFPIFSNCRVIPMGEDGQVFRNERDSNQKGGVGKQVNCLQARMDVDLSDFITLAIETKLLLNYPKPLVAVLPVALAVSVVRFSGTLSISFIPGGPETPTLLTFSFLDDYRLDLSIRSLVGSMSRLQDLPKIAQMVEKRLHKWFSDRVVEPVSQQIELPSLWPRKKNMRGGEDERPDFSTEIRENIHSGEGSENKVSQRPVREGKEVIQSDVELKSWDQPQRRSFDAQSEGLKWRKPVALKYPMASNMPGGGVK